MLWLYLYVFNHNGRLLTGSGRISRKFPWFRIGVQVGTVTRMSGWWLSRFQVFGSILLRFFRSMFPRERISRILWFFVTFRIYFSEEFPSGSSLSKVVSL